MTEQSHSLIGRKHEDCLNQLHGQIRDVLAEYKESHVKFPRLLQKFIAEERLKFIHNALPIFFCSIWLFVSVQSENYWSNFLNGLVILILSVFNLATVFFFYVKRSLIIYEKAKLVLALIENLDSNEQINYNIFDIQMPYSQSISSQETIREGKLYNMPLNLVVKGDLIKLRPGKEINVCCQSISKCPDTNDFEKFEPGTIFEPKDQFDRKSGQMDELFYRNDHESFFNSYIESCELIKTPESIYCTALETPYLTRLRSILYNHINDSDSLIKNEICAVRRLILIYLLPIFLVFQILISLISYFAFHSYELLYWTNFSYLLLPLFPVSFTLFWKISTLHGTVSLLKSLKCLKKLLNSTTLSNNKEITKKRRSSKKHKYAKYTKGTNSDKNSDGTNNECLITDKQLDMNISQGDLSQINELSSIESLISAIPDVDERHRRLKGRSSLRLYFAKLKRRVKFYFDTVNLILFNKPSLTHHGGNDLDVQNASFIYYSNFLIGLGIITNFACIDKKGVLSWPNPTADKILAFKNINDQNKSDDIDSDHVDDNSQTCNLTGETSLINHQTEQTKRHKKLPDKNKIETYNLTHDNLNGYKLKFDDIDWEKNLNSLKPLGLSILLNTCNLNLSKCYDNLCDFIKLESNQIVHTNQIESHLTRFHFTTDTSSFNSNMSIDENFELKAVIDRRCLCEISKIIGFDKEIVTRAFNVAGTASICRNLEIKSVSKVRPKQIRVSSVYSTIAIDQSFENTTNLYSQGSPDLIFDFCNDYWNGEQVCELSKNQRKKLLDLYQRYSAASYCTAFSYKPLIEDENLSELAGYENGLVLKCPPSYCEKMSSLSDFANLIDCEDETKNLSLTEIVNNQSEFQQSEPCFNETSMPIKPDHDEEKTKIENMLSLHSGQVFLGMISMQYSAKTDVMKLIEKLEKSCIRFIHFSYENEQISRTFAEMLGLDTGWNCHISLGNDTSIASKKLTTEQMSTLSRTDCQFADTSKPHVPDRTFFNKLAIFKTIRSKENFKFRKDNYNRLKNTSLPDIKIALHHPETESFFGQYQIGKIDNLNYHKKLKACRLRKKRKMKRLNSSCSYYESSVSSESNELETSKARLLSKCWLPDVESVKSLKSHTHAAVNLLMDDEVSSSHRTVYSGRSLSETEILGNAAQLPKGVENIRHHLAKEIDNVPLHVSLFTDSTKPAITQMIEIMKEYGEIVACFGSTHSIENNEIFSTSNISIGVEPLYPKLCVNQSSQTRSRCCIEDDLKADLMMKELPLNELNVYMNTLSCGLNLRHGNASVILPPLLSLAREIIHSYRIALIFMLMCNLSISFVQLICNLLFLPPILSGFQVIFLVLFTIPVLSYSLINKNERNDLRCSNKKNTNLINQEDVKSFAYKFLVKFIPSICILVVFHFLSLYLMCKENNLPSVSSKYESTNSNTTNTSNNSTNTNKNNCNLYAIDLIFSEDHYELFKYWSSYDTLLFSQIFNHFFLSIYFVFISINYVCIEKSIWAYLPFKNRTWTKTVITVLAFHMLYLFIRLYTLTIERTLHYCRTIPVEYWTLTIMWPFLLILLNEFFKFFEIKETLRQYKKLKLEFDTKLGMNSPFV